MRAIKSLTYKSPFNDKELKVVACRDSYYMTLTQMGRLFDCSVREIYTVLKSLFKSKELEENFVNKAIEIQNFDNRYIIGNFYNLDAIIAVGYRLNPKEATHFHIWSTRMLKTDISKVGTKEEGIIQSIRRKFSHMLSVA